MVKFSNCKSYEVHLNIFLNFIHKTSYFIIGLINDLFFQVSCTKNLIKVFIIKLALLFLYIFIIQKNRIIFSYYKFRLWYKHSVAYSRNPIKRAFWVVRSITKHRDSILFFYFLKFQSCNRLVYLVIDNNYSRIVVVIVIIIFI